MRYSAECVCGFETPLVDDEQEIDWGLLDAHQEFCKSYQKVYLEEQNAATFLNRRQGEL